MTEFTKIANEVKNTEMMSKFLISIILYVSYPPHYPYNPYYIDNIESKGTP